MSSRSFKKIASVKKGVDADEARRKREDNIIELRKSKREENLQKRRQMIDSFDDSSMFGTDSTMGGGAAGGSTPPSSKLAGLAQLIPRLYSEDAEEQYLSTQGFRKLLSIEKNPPIDEVIQANVIPRFVQFLQRPDHPKLQFEAAWALTNVASGTSIHTRVVIDAGAVPIFVALLSSPELEVREQAVWALGNVAGDNPECRDMVLAQGALLPVLGMMNDACPPSLLRNCTWTLSNFCRGKPQPRFEQVGPALPLLSALLRSEDAEVLTDACWALSYLSDGTNDKIQAVIDAGVGRRLVELLLYPSPTVLVPALRTVGNIVTGDDIQTDYMISEGVLPCLTNLLINANKKSIKKETCWTISNITAGTIAQIQRVIESGLIPPLINMLSSGEFDIKKEAAWAVSNATSGGTPDQIKFLVQSGCIPPLCELLVVQDNRIINVALEGLENILKVGRAEKELGRETTNPFARLVDECGGLDKIETLQQHKSDDIYDKAFRIIEQFFGDEEETDEALAPTVDASGGYAFGGMGGAPGGGFHFG